MSFRLKTVLLVLGASVIPYVLISLVFLYQLKNDISVIAQNQLKSRIEQITGMVDHELKLITKDLEAAADMEVMADILTMDLDRRIFEVLERKKQAFSLVGDYYVCDLAQNVIVSTNQKVQIGSKLKTDGMFKKEIKPTFKNETIGFIYLDYKLQNLDKFLLSIPSQKFYVVNLSAISEPQIRGKAIGKITSMPPFAVVGEINKEEILSALDKRKNALLLYLIGGFAVIATFSYFFASTISRPILSLSEKIREIAESKEYSKRVEVTSKDEVAKASEAFNGLLSSMEDAISKLAHESENRLRLAEEQSKSETLSQMAQKLSRYISPQLVESIFSGEQNAKLESKRKKLTIFFSDIVDFTSTTDNMEAEDLASILNHYLNEMSLIALRYGATIDKFIGDAVMLFFGDPKSLGDKEDAVRCVKMALDMRKKLDELSDYWQNKGITRPFRARFGIHTGYCTVGNFGNEERMEYTIIGGSVNLASRIESKANPNQILISEETYLLVRDAIECVYVDTISVKGMAYPVKIYEAAKILGAATDPFEVSLKGLGLKIDPSKVENIETAKQILNNAILILEKEAAVKS